MKIPLIDLDAQFAEIEGELLQRIEGVVRSHQYVLGPEVSALEDDLAKYCGTAHGVGVASGTDALIIGLKALGLGPGDEVITTAFTFFSTASSIVHAGATPVFVDVEPDTCLIDVDRVAEAVTEKTRAVIPVHIFGQCADMGALGKLAGSAGLKVIEDACQAIGAEQDGRRAGSMGDLAALSFYPSKNLGGCGDGGMILTNDQDLAEKAKLLRDHGTYEEYGRACFGHNSRLDSIQAAALSVKLSRLDRWADRRRQNALHYNRRFKGAPLVPLSNPPGRLHVYNNYVVRTGRRDDLHEFLSKNGVGARIYYQTALHQMPCFAPWLPDGFTLAETEKAVRECLALPCYPEMTEEMVDRVADLVLEFFETG